VEAIYFDLITLTLTLEYYHLQRSGKSYSPPHGSSHEPQSSFSSIGASVYLCRQISKYLFSRHFLFSPEWVGKK